MDEPVSIFAIYQPTRLLRRRDGTTVEFADLLKSESDAVIFGGPGRGKTMLMRYVFVTLCQRQDLVPLLFTLRWQEAANDLATFVTALSDKTLKRGKARVILLIDGFDEIAAEAKRRVASALRDFASLSIGNFYLTCRSYYAADDVSAPHWHIAPFIHADIRNFIQAFARSYGGDLNAETLIADLRERGFNDFLEHPLMLALVCILKSGPMPSLPRTTIGLIRRAVDTLTFRWDESKRISRESRYNLDGEERLRCLIRIAFAMEHLIEKEDVVVQATQEHLRLIQRPDVSVDHILEELAQWYGLLIPIEEDRWSFVHRSIHDFLAARFWLETEGFNPDDVFDWNSRAAYAACLTNDATRSMVRSLQRTNDINTVAECLANGAPFDVDAVAIAVVEHFRRVRNSGSIERGAVVSVRTSKGLFYLASSDFLYAMLRAANQGTTIEDDVILWCCVVELAARSAVIPRSTRQDLLDRFGGESVNVVAGEKDYRYRISDILAI